jgi:hypothetical protein
VVVYFGPPPQMLGVLEGEVLCVGVCTSSIPASIRTANLMVLDGDGWFS